jgi:hypothetical protein
MEHVGIDPAYGKPLIVDAAPAVFEEYAGAVRLRPEGVARYVEAALLVAGIEVRRRDEGVRRKPADTVGVLFEQKDMAVELAGATPSAAVAGEPDLTNDLDEFLFRELEEIIAFRFESGNLFIERERNRQPPSSRPARTPGSLPQCWPGRGICPSARDVTVPANAESSPTVRMSIALIFGVIG